MFQAESEMTDTADRTLSLRLNVERKSLYQIEELVAS